jgi:DNA-binding NtrC family response regulator
MPSVLIVDDEAGFRELLTRFLAQLDCTIEQAGDAESALELLNLIPVAVVLCDLSMPGRGGEWLVAQIHDRFPTVAIILATSNDAVPPRVSLQRGVVGYLLKPFVMVDVLNAVAEAIVWNRAASRQAERKLDNTKRQE